jgi:O-antigen/teichoic acid export membrane protein
MSDTSLPMPERLPLKRRVIAASAWSLGGYGVGLAIRFGTNLVMTRLLVPEMFGVMAIATVVMVGLAMFSDLGLGQNIVQSRRGGDPDFINTAWSVQILRGFVLWAFALGMSLAILLADRYGLVPGDSVYADPSLPLVIAVLGFGTVIGGFQPMRFAEASRNLALGRITQIEIASQLCGLACMLVWAAFDRSVWVLVAGATAAGVARNILGHVWLPGTKNRWHWDKGAFAEIFHFGKWIFASSILGFLVGNSDKLLLGWMVDSSVLGVYAIAFLMFSAVEQIISRIITGVAFPALSEVARSERDLKAAYYRFHAVVASIAYFSAGALVTSAPTLVGVLYDARYADAGWMLQILAAILLVLPLQIAVQCFVVLGVPQLLTRTLIVRLAALIAAMPIGFALFGLSGALWGIVVSQFAAFLTLALFTSKLGLLHLGKEMVALPVMLVGACAGKILALALGS